VTVELVEAAPVAGALRFTIVRHAGAAAQRAGQHRHERPKFRERQKQRRRR